MIQTVQALIPARSVPLKLDRVLTVLQLAGTIAILVCAPTNAAKAVLLPCLWLLTFQRLKVTELVLYVGVCALFTVMDILSVAQGVFVFDHPDFLGIPCYEPLLWGFYVLHTIRAVQSAKIQLAPYDNPADANGSTGRRILSALLLAIPFGATFSVFNEAQILLAVTGVLLIASLILFHEPDDFAYVGYMIFLGAVIEYSGVWRGQWHYVPAPTGGVPLWFATMWGGVGLFARNLALPLLGLARGKWASSSAQSQSASFMQVIK